MNYLTSILIGVLTFVGGLFPQAPQKSYLDYDWQNPPLSFGSITFPSSLDAFENPGATQSVATVVTHSTQHANENDAIEALEAKMRTDGSITSGTQVFASNGTNSGWTTFATTTSLYSANILATGSTTLQNFTALQSTSTNATSTNFFATTASSTNLFSTNFNLGKGNLGWSTTTNATTTNLFSSIASSTNLYSADASIGRATTTDLDINTVSYAWPSSQGSNSTVLTNNGTGGLTWSSPASGSDLLADGTTYTTNNTSTTTLYTLKVTAGTIAATNGMKIEAMLENTGGSDAAVFDVQMGTGLASTTIGNLFFPVTTGAIRGMLEIWVYNHTASTQDAIYRSQRVLPGTTPAMDEASSTPMAINTANTFYLSFRGKSVSGTSAARTAGLNVRQIK